MYETIKFEIKDSIAYVTINRPKAMNALNSQVLDELYEVYGEIYQNPDIRAVIMTGEGKAFVAGADIAEMSKLNAVGARDFAKKGHKVMNRIETIEKPVIAAINGFALGGGCELAMSCDIRIASTKAKFGQPEVGLGLIPGFGGNLRLSRLVGKGNAKWMIFSGEMIDAEAAYRIGLVQKVVEPEELMAEAEAIAAKIAKQAPIAVAVAMDVVNNGHDVDLKSGSAYEVNAFSLIFDRLGAFFSLFTVILSDGENAMKKNRHQMSLITSLTRMILVALIVCMVPAFAAATEIDKAAEKPARQMPNGHKHVDVEIYHGPGSMAAQEAYGSYPAKYDSRTQSWYQGIQVNDQGNTNLCWACAASEAAQISYAKETAGAQRTRTSPPQLGHYFYNRVNDPLGNTEGDSNEAWYGDWVMEGGNAVNTFQHMATWSGLVSYDDAPMTLDENDDYIGYGDWFANIEGEPFPQRLAYDSNILTEQNTVFYEKLDYRSEADRNIIKSLLLKYGAVGISMDFQDFYFTDGDSSGVSYYNPDPFSKPQKAGAWIIMNSWGEYYHDDGYFYASYESKDLLADGICAFDMQAPSSYKYNFQYDGNAYNGNDTLEKGEKAANVFSAPLGQQIRLDAVGMTVWNDADTDYQIQVYTGLTSPNEPESGALACTMNASTDSPGFKTIKLPQSVVVDGGENYSIVITFLSDKTRMGYEENYDDPRHGKRIRLVLRACWMRGRRRRGRGARGRAGG